MTRVMPRAVNLGTRLSFGLGTYKFYMEKPEVDFSGQNGSKRRVCGYIIPSWQRGIVWTHDQQVRLVESAWLGIPLGTMTYNRGVVYTSPFDNLLLDGQQRLFSLERYWKDEFDVFGYFWSEVPEDEKRGFENQTILGAYETRSDDERYLRSYYDLMNFGGVAHTDDQRATA